MKEYDCGLGAALDVIGGKWKVLIMWPLKNGASRFGELKREVPGISEKMLIQSLKELELDGIVLRQDFKEVPPRVEYSLTEFGRSLWDALVPLCQWGEQHMQRIEACKATCEMQRKAKEEALAASSGTPPISAAPLIQAAPAQSQTDPQAST